MELLRRSEVPQLRDFLSVVFQNCYSAETIAPVWDRVRDRFHAFIMASRVGEMYDYAYWSEMRDFTNTLLQQRRQDNHSFHPGVADAVSEPHDIDSPDLLPAVAAEAAIPQADSVRPKRAREAQKPAAGEPLAAAPKATVPPGPKRARKARQPAPDPRPAERAAVRSPKSNPRVTSALSLHQRMDTAWLNKLVEWGVLHEDVGLLKCSECQESLKVFDEESTSEGFTVGCRAHSDVSCFRAPSSNRHCLLSHYFDEDGIFLVRKKRDASSKQPGPTTVLWPIGHQVAAIYWFVHRPDGKPAKKVMKELSVTLGAKTPLLLDQLFANLRKAATIPLLRRSAGPRPPAMRRVEMAEVHFCLGSQYTFSKGDLGARHCKRQKPKQQEHFAVWLSALLLAEVDGSDKERHWEVVLGDVTEIPVVPNRNIKKQPRPASMSCTCASQRLDWKGPASLLRADAEVVVFSGKAKQSDMAYNGTVHVERDPKWTGLFDAEKVTFAEFGIGIQPSVNVLAQTPDNNEPDERIGRVVVMHHTASVMQKFLDVVAHNIVPVECLRSMRCGPQLENLLYTLQFAKWRLEKARSVDEFLDLMREARYTRSCISTFKLDVTTGLQNLAHEGLTNLWSGGGSPPVAPRSFELPPWHKLREELAPSLSQ